MENLIEKYGLKKILIFTVGGITLLVLVLFLIKKIGTGEKKILSCSKSFQITESTNMDVSYDIFKVGDDYKIKIVSDSPLNDELSDEEIEFINKFLIDVFVDEYKTYIDDNIITYKNNDKKGFISYSFDININKDNSLQVYNLLNIDFYNTSVDELKSLYESGGYKCTK